MTTTLERGDQLPEILSPPPGPRSRALARDLARLEAPAANTLFRGEPSIVWSEALGANVLDVDGNRYIDLTAGFGVAAVGHRHPAVQQAIESQAGRLVHGMADVAAHPDRLRLAERLVEMAPMPDAQVYFAISGGDAVEIALKTAWLATGRSTTVVFDPAYHGTTLGALAATSRPAFREPFAAHLNPDVVRLPYGAPMAQLGPAIPEGVAAVLVEPVVGREGILLPPDGWLAGLAELCSERGALLIADEIYTGFGRTGYLFACEADGVEPDLLCCGKALGGGLPIAAVLGSKEIFRAWDRDGEALHTATFMANPIACAAALASLDVIEADELVGRARELGQRMQERARRWSAAASVDRVVGRGLAWTVEMQSADVAGGLARAAASRGLLALSSGRRCQLAPPLVISEPQWEFALDVVEELLEN